MPGRRTSTRRSGEPQGGGVPVGPVLPPVHPAHIDPGRSGQPVGPGRRHSRWPAPARLVHPGLQTGEDRPVGRVGEQVLDRHGLGRSPIPDRLDQRPGRQPAARVRPDHRRCRHPLSARRLPRQQVAQRLGAGRVHPSRQPGRRCPGSEPASGRFGAEVVVGRAVRLPGQVVARRVRPRAEHRHRHHHRGSTARRDTDGPTRGCASARPMPPRARTRGGRRRGSSCLHMCRETRRPEGWPQRNLEESLRRTPADRSGHHINRFTAGGWSRARSERIGAGRTGVRSCPPRWSLEVVRQVVQSHTGADALLQRAADPRPWGLVSEWSTGSRTDR